MKDFAAIDFETANNERSSVCSVGLVIVRNGEIVDSFYSLIQPGLTTITTGALRCMVFVVKIRKMPLYSPKYGLRLNL